MSLILSINAGINSSVGVFKNGKPIICVEEERFNRIKNWFGFPEKALQYLLDNKLVEPHKLTDIAVCDELLGNVSRERFYQRYANHYDKGKQLAYNEGFAQTKQDIKSKLKSTGFYKSFVEGKGEQKDLQYNERLHKQLASLGFDEKKVVHVEHHLCHASAAYYGLASSLDDDYLVFTLDGGGDNLRSTVSIAQKGVLNRQSATNEYSIGNIYSAVTHHLGFRSHEHEYKLMGLAPYVKEEYAEQCKRFFEHYLFLENNDTSFANPEFINHSVFFAELIKEFTGSRFDNVAAGLQAFTEDIVVRWVKGNISKYGIKKIVCAGGVFMNVKLNKLIAELPEVEWVNVFPSCGDETNIFGAAFYVHNSKYEKNVGLLNKFTLGTSCYVTSEVLNKYKDAIAIEQHEDINGYTAKLLADNNIVARCSGKMEFGARALGNRSVLANPSRMQNVAKINQSIKKRDFWMPFAPAMLKEDAVTFIEVPKALGHGSPYMMFAFDTIEERRDDIVCGVHQADHTARAQIVDKELYPEFHDLISKYKELTGVGCLLNTSFNLHGYPIVENAEQAIEVLLNSEIDVLVINNYSIKRK